MYTSIPIAKSDIIPIDNLLDGVIEGETRVPKFQRPFVWSTDDMIQLFDSVLRGYPIGSLLMWQTERRDISSLTKIGPIGIESEGPLIRQFVVDGHQRLATLVGVLRLPENFPRTTPDEWKWWVAFDLRSEQFVHVSNANEPIPLHYLPLRSILRTVDFVRYSRKIIDSEEFTEPEKSAFIDRADVVQKVFRDYRIPVTVLRSRSIDDAVTIFARVNQRGRDMSPDQMVSALTYREKGEGDFDLASSIDETLGELRAVGFGDLERKIILQVVLALAGLDFTRPAFERLVNKDSHTIMRAAVSNASAALRGSIEFLGDAVGLRSSRLLPYASIIVMLSIFNHELGVSHRKLTDQDRRLLIRWFWGTSFNGWFAGANTTDIRRAGDIMRDFAKHGVSVAGVVEAEFLNRPIRLFPETFDRRSARVRALLLVQILSGKPRNPETGEDIDGFDVFADQASRDIPYFFPKRRRPKISSPANRVILPAGFPKNARPHFVTIEESYRDEVLRSHYISEVAFQALISDDFDTFISEREKALDAAERSFLSGLELSLDGSAARSEEEYDADQ